MHITEFVKNMSDEQLRQAFEEIHEWKYVTGTLRKGIVRETHEQYESIQEYEIPLRVIEDALLYEMARRYATS